jgi:hypothetical protein
MTSITGDKRLLAQLTLQILKDTEDMGPNGDFLRCIRYETTWRKIPGKETEPLPGCYRYHETRIHDAAAAAKKILEIVENI